MPLKNKLMLTLALVTATGSCFAIFENQDLRGAILLNDMKNVERALARGANVNTSYLFRGQYTPLLYATKNNNIGMVKFLISKGADVNASDINGRTPLMIAVSNDNVALVELLIKHGAAVNVFNSQGYTPLMLAIFKDNSNIAKLLIHRGTDVNTTSNDGVTPLMIAAMFNRGNLARLLVEKGADVNAHSQRRSVTPLTLAVKYSDATLVKFLLKHGADDYSVSQALKAATQSLTRAENNRRKIVLSQIITALEKHKDQQRK